MTIIQGQVLRRLGSALVLFLLSEELLRSQVESGGLELIPRNSGRIDLVLESDTDGVVQVDVSTNLVHWRAFLRLDLQAARPRQFELPSEGLRKAFFRVKKRTDLAALLKPMIFVPGGTFWMGQEGNYASALNLPVAGPVHEVTLSSFTMDAHEVTLREWRDVQAWATHPDRGNRQYEFRFAGGALDFDHPVSTIDWFETLKWANARSEMEGLEPVYYTDETMSTVYRKGVRRVYNNGVKWSGHGYRLPTEAEWEYASRGGLDKKIYPWGDKTPTPSQANFGYHFSRTTPVGDFPPNGYGLFDMAGNVREWCWDSHRDDPTVSYTNHIVFAPYDAFPQTDPIGPEDGPRGMSRGGSWVDTRHFIQCGRRHNDERDRVAVFLGFRLVTRKP